MRIAAVISFFALFQAIIMPAQKINSQAPMSDSIIGEWFTQDNSSIVKIYKSGSVFYGQVVWLKVPINADGQMQRDKRGVPIVGSTILSSLNYVSDGSWSEGLMYVGPRGATYSCIVKMLDNDTIEIRVTMELGITKVEKWKRRA